MSVYEIRYNMDCDRMWAIATECDRTSRETSSHLGHYVRLLHCYNRNQELDHRLLHQSQRLKLKLAINCPCFTNSNVNSNITETRYVAKSCILKG